MTTPPTQLQPPYRRARVYRRENVRGGRVTSLLLAETPVPSPAPSPTVLVSQMAARYFGALPSSCAGLVVASATVADVGAGASCGYVFHPTSAARLPLIRLDAPHLESRLGYALLTYPIVGGLLVRTAVGASGRSGLGSFSFEVIGSGASTSFAVRVDDFAARLLGSGTSVLLRLLYQGSESLVHRVLAARFLREFMESLAL